MTARLPPSSEPTGAAQPRLKCLNLLPMQLRENAHVGQAIGDSLHCAVTHRSLPAANVTGLHALAGSACSSVYGRARAPRFQCTVRTVLAEQRRPAELHTRARQYQLVPLIIAQLQLSHSVPCTQSAGGAPARSSLHHVISLGLSKLLAQRDRWLFMMSLTGSTSTAF